MKMRDSGDEQADCSQASRSMISVGAIAPLTKAHLHAKMDMAAKVPSQHHITTFKTRSEIEALRGFWNSCNPSRDADLDFFLFISEIYPNVDRPHVVVLHTDGAPTALLAGRLEIGHVPVKLGYFSVPGPKLRILQVVHGGWLGDFSEANTRLLMNSVIGRLAAGDVDVVSLHSPRTDSSIFRNARALPAWPCSDRATRPQARRICELSAEAGQFLPSLSQNERYQQRKRARNLASAFSDHRIERFTKPSDVDQLARDAEIIAARSYQRGLSVGFSNTQITRERLSFEARMGWLEGYVLYLNGEPAAFWIGSLRNQVFLSEYLSFDPAYAKYSPGMYLILKIIEELNAGQKHNPVRLVDFGIGDAPYKERLATLSWQESSILIFARRPKAILVNALRSSFEMANRFAKQILRLSPSLAKLKRRWRAMVTAGKN